MNQRLSTRDFFYYYTWHYDAGGQLLKSSCPYEAMLAGLASRVGYAEYYLSRKFKEETGISLNNYINIAKVEQAKLLLTITDDSIREITERPHFCSRSYFSESFRKITGTSPAKYRKDYAGG